MIIISFTRAYFVIGPWTAELTQMIKNYTIIIIIIIYSTRAYFVTGPWAAELTQMMKN
jgi:hypothetical protein